MTWAAILFLTTLYLVETGDKAYNTRTFKTTVPVYGTELDIRTLDKTIKND